MKAYIDNIKNFIGEKYKRFIIWMDCLVSKYLMDNDILLYFIYTFCILYLILNIILLKNDKVLLLLLFLFIIYIIKYLKFILDTLNKNERLIIFNMLFLLINLLTIFFNVLRYLLQNVIVYIRKYIYEIILYLFNIKLSINLTYIIDNIIPLISLNLIYGIFSMYFFFSFWNNFLDLDKPDMEEKDYKDSWVVKYKKLFQIIYYLWLSTAFLMLYLHFICGLPHIDFIEWILILSFICLIIFLLNAIYVVLKYFKR